jgi:glycopeptide antibiotics resistance protein
MKKMRLVDNVFTPDCVRKAVFFSYLIGLFSQTILPIWDILFVDGKWIFQVSTYSSRSLNLIPFRTVSEFLNSYSSFYSTHDYANIRIVNLLGNVILFLPIGFLLPIAFYKLDKIYKITICSASISVFIEVVQYFVERSTDIDDVILNTMGAVIGGLFYKMVQLMLWQNDRINHENMEKLKA